MSDTPANPKPFYLVEDQSIGFENGAPVRVTWPGEKKESSAQFILNGLEDSGVKFPDVALAIRVIEQGLDAEGDLRAAEVLRLLCSRVGGGKRGAELRAAIIGLVDGFSGQDAANQFGMSRQVWHTNVTRLRRRLLGCK